MIQQLDPISRLNRDIREAATILGQVEARFLVDAYYIIQEDRKRSFNQVEESRRYPLDFWVFV